MNWRKILFDFQVKQLKSFEKKQAKGFLRFCILDGIVFTLIFIVLRILWEIITVGWSWIDWNELIKDALINDVFLGMFVLGPFTWFMNKKMLAKIKNNK